MFEAQVIARAVRHYESAHQLRKVTEECGELIAEISRLQNLDPEPSQLRALASEVADVRIVLGQLDLIFPGLDGLVEMATRKKLLRLEQRINKEQERASQ